MLASLAYVLFWVQDAMLSGEVMSGPLGNKALSDLDALLNKTDMYSQFLMENLQSMQASSEAETEAEPEAAPSKAGTKRKAGKAGGKAAKKQKPISATKVGTTWRKEQRDTTH